MPEPFVRGSFDELPDRPRVPHPYFDTHAETLTWESRPFGRMAAHVRIHGKGPPLLLVHGLMTTSYSWRYVLEPLGERFTLHIPDLPGAGRSDKPLRPSYRPEHMAEWLSELQWELGIRGCPVVGNSMGGYICLWLALRDPGALSCLVDLHSPGVVEPRLRLLEAAFSLPGASRLFDWLVRRDPERWVHRNVHYWDETLKSREEAREYGGPLRTREGVCAFEKFLRETLATAPMHELERLLQARRAKEEPFPVPLLLLYAEQDPMVPARFGRVLAKRIPDARLVWLEQASHFAHVDAVPRFLPPLLRFLSEHARASSGKQAGPTSSP
jgi:pimeloyl-ACP methyl ester carboxylesterase